EAFGPRPTAAGPVAMDVIGEEHEEVSGGDVALARGIAEKAPAGGEIDQGVSVHAPCLQGGDLAVDAAGPVQGGGQGEAVAEADDLEDHPCFIPKNTKMECFTHGIRGSLPSMLTTRHQGPP